MGISRFLLGSNPVFVLQYWERTLGEHLERYWYVWI